MCGGRDRNRERRKADKERKKQERLARKRQEELDRLAKKREKIVADQLIRQDELKDQSDLIAANQAKTIKDLQDQQEIDLKAINDKAAADKAAIERNASDRAAGITSAAATRAQQIKDAAALQAGRIERAGNAGAASIRVLGQKQPTAPTAQQTRRGARKAGARATPPNVERGSARSTRGTNLSI